MATSCFISECLIVVQDAGPAPHFSAVVYFGIIAFIVFVFIANTALPMYSDRPVCEAVNTDKEVLSRPAPPLLSFGLLYAFNYGIQGLFPAAFQTQMSMYKWTLIAGNVADVFGRFFQMESMAVHLLWVAAFMAVVIQTFVPTFFGAIVVCLAFFVATAVRGAAITSMQTRSGTAENARDLGIAGQVGGIVGSVVSLAMGFFI